MTPKRTSKLDAELQTVVDRATALHIPIAAICARAGIHETTFYRWKSGVQPGFYIRQTFIETARQMIEDKKQEYLNL